MNVLARACCVVLGLAAIGCGGRGDANRLRGVSVTISTTTMDQRYTVTATLPDAVAREFELDHTVIVDTAGGEHRAISAGRQQSTSGVTVFTTTFSLPEGTEPRIIRVGDYDLDYTKSTITRR